MHRLDVFLLDRVHQPICDALYHRVGDCMVIARFALMQAIGLTVCITIAYLGLHGLSDIFAFFYVAAQIGVMAGLSLSVYALRHLLGRTGPNPMRFTLFVPRMLMVVWAFVAAISMVILLITSPFGFDTLRIIGDLIRNVLLISGFYFSSCHNQPPSRRFSVRAAA
jgi:hypothetical protein